jgi:hypothetical protein
VPVTNGATPEVPDGGHSSHAGAVLELAAAAEPDDLADPVEPEEVAPALPRAVEAPPSAADPIPLPLPTDELRSAV